MTQDRLPQLPSSLALGRDYWLCRCDGFRVDGPDGRLGIVVEARYRSRHDVPDHLVVYGGLFGSRVTIVPVSDILDIEPRRLRIQAATAPARPSRQRLARLCAAVAHRHASAELPV